MKLNLGCGDRHQKGFINVDKQAFYKPNFHWDLEQFPWPWDDNSVDEVLLVQVLEHLGASTEIYFKVMQELYRVCKPDAKIHIEVPHWRHDNFLHDPTHVRPITDIGLAMFSQERNLSHGAAETKLGLLLHVDFKKTYSKLMLEPDVQKALDTGVLTEEQVQHLLRTQNNIAYDLVIGLQVIKPATSEKQNEQTISTWNWS